ncbi:MAG: MFS transporter [Desulfobacterales bacterium]|jgi:PPP family 3-phenylpropionic acid transporter|nr:MFS transporter [Desulfobacterales bacterium]
MEKDSSQVVRSIVSIQYFLYFGVLGIFLPYFNLYCYHIGLTGFQIGAISGIRSAAFALFPLLWGAIADRSGGQRPIYIFCSIMSMLIWAFYLMTSSFWPMLIITFFYGLFYSPIISFLEAATMETLGKHKRHYGRIRAWGSISFILAVIGFGKFTDSFSMRLILFGILGISLLQCAFSFGMPKTAALGKLLNAKQVQPLFTRGTVIFLICGFLMLVSHGAYYGFFSIHLETLGCSKTFIGAAWALAVTAEILVMVNSGKLFRHLSLEKILAYSFFIAAARWLILSTCNTPAILFASQILHAFTYGAFHMASILYMDRLSPEKSKTMGQAVNNAVTYGLGLMVGFFLSGALYKAAGAYSLFLINAGIALAAGILFRYRGGVTIGS